MPGFELLRRQSPRLVLLEALGLAGLIGWADFATGWEWSFFMLYAVPIVLVVWKADRNSGFAFALICAAIWCAAQLGSNPYHTAWGFILAAASRWFYFMVLVIATATVKLQRASDRARIESLEQARGLELEILHASEREQQRIGRDLHDGLGPHLAAIGYAATFLADDLRRQGHPESAKAERIRELTTDAVKLARDLARGIFPVQMGGVGLSVALEELARTSTSLTAMTVAFCERGDTSLADDVQAMHFYRIAREAVNNAARHSGASSVTILLNRIEDSLRLTIADDGKGMPPRCADHPGMGMNSMRFRARALGGELAIESSPDDGTVIYCAMPCPSLGPQPSAS